MTGNSCVSQLVSSTHDIYKRFDCNAPLDARGIFVDISKAFDKIWHDGSILKLQTYDIDGNLRKLLKSYLKDPEERVVLFGQMFSRKNILAGVLQGCLLESLYSQYILKLMK